MVKLVVFCTKAIFVVIIAVLFSSCRHSINIGTGIKGNGNVQTEKRAISEKFTKVEVDSGIEVIIEQNNAVSVQVEVDENIMKHLTTKVKNGVLEVTFDTDVNNTGTPIVRIAMPVIEGLSADSGASISSKNTLKSTSENTKLSINSDSAASIELNIEFDETTINSDSGAEVKIAGKSLKLTTHSDSGASIDAGNLLANDVISTADSGASTTVHPLVSLNATADSGASITYNNVPKNISKTEDSGGSVSKE